MKARLPQGWALAALADGCEVIQGQSPPGETYNIDGTGLPFFQGKAEFGPLHPVATKWCSPPGKIAEPGDVLISIRAPVGPTNLADVRCCIGRGLAAIRPLGGIEYGYVLYYLRHSASVLAEESTGSTFDAVGGSQLRKHPFVISPLPEQHRIVEAIESYFTRLDDAVATLERVRRNLKRYRASVLKAAVEGRLVPTEAELARAEGREYEPASVLLDRILAERRRRWQDAGGRGKDQEPVAPDTTGLPELPQGWCWATVDALTILGSQNGLYVPKRQYGAGVPILRIDDYQTDWSRSSNELQRVDISDADAQNYGLAVGDIVINRVNSPSHLGKSLAVLERHVPAAFESNMMRLALATDVLPGFIQYYLSSMDGKTRLTSNAKWAVNQASINQGDVGATAVPLPPLAEQRRIVAELGTLLSTSAASEHVSAAAAARCARLRQSILKWAFEGKLADQDPYDEPASVLLERIRTETASRAASTRPTRHRSAGGRKGTMTDSKKLR